MTLFAIRDTPLDLSEALSAVSAAECGGLCTFVGQVRDHNEGRAVSLLEYEAYASMAEKQMRRIAEGIAAEIPEVRLCALHRVGQLSVGDWAVVCVAAAPHRDEAFRACRRLIDRIKADVPIWKREHGTDGPYWVGWQDARCRGHHDSNQHGVDQHGVDQHGVDQHGVDAGHHSSE